jgi:hypothetical protein
MSDLICSCGSVNVVKALNIDTLVEDCYTCLDCGSAWPLDGDNSGDEFLIIIVEEEDQILEIG